MKIVVCVKEVGLLGDEVEFEGNRVDPDFLDRALNEWDAYAIEAALQLREAVGGEVVAVTVGDEDTEGVLRRALAMGADRAARIEGELDFDALAPARALAPVVAEEAPDLVICGAQSSDAANAATPAALAALLDAPCVAVVRSLTVAGGHLVAHRELEGGVVDVVEVDLPAVISVQTGANTPRYAALRAIRQAEEIDIPTHALAEHDPPTRVIALRLPGHAGTTILLEGDSAEIARQIAALVKERVG